MPSEPQTILTTLIDNQTGNYLAPTTVAEAVVLEDNTTLDTALANVAYASPSETPLPDNISLTADKLAHTLTFIESGTQSTFDGTSNLTVNIAGGGSGGGASNLQNGSGTHSLQQVSSISKGINSFALGTSRYFEIQYRYIYDGPDNIIAVGNSSGYDLDRGCVLWIVDRNGQGAYYYITEVIGVEGEDTYIALGTLEQDIRDDSKTIIRTHRISNVSAGSTIKVYQGGSLASDSVAEGTFTTNVNVTAQTEFNETFLNHSHAEGSNNLAAGEAAHAEGEYNIARGDMSHAEGRWNTTDGNHSHAEGYFTKTWDSNAHAEGQYTHAYGRASHAEGNASKARGENSHSEGQYSVADGINAHAEGYSTFARGAESHTEGNYTLALGEVSHAEGFSEEIEAQVISTSGKMVNVYSNDEVRKISTSFLGLFPDGYYREIESVEGTGPITITFITEIPYVSTGSRIKFYSNVSRGNYSHVEGKYTLATGEAAHAQGVGTKALGEASTATGMNTRATGAGAFVCGRNNKILHTYTRKFTLSSSKSGELFVRVGNYSGNPELTYECEFLAPVLKRITATEEIIYTQPFPSTITDQSPTPNNSWRRTSQTRQFTLNDEVSVRYTKFPWSIIEFRHTGVTLPAGNYELCVTGIGDISSIPTLGVYIDSTEVSTGNTYETYEADKDLLFIIGNGTSSNIKQRSNAFEVDAKGNAYVGTTIVPDYDNVLVPKSYVDAQINSLKALLRSYGMDI